MNTILYRVWWFDENYRPDGEPVEIECSATLRDVQDVEALGTTLFDGFDYPGALDIIEANEFAAFVRSLKDNRTTATELIANWPEMSIGEANELIAFANQ